MAKNPIINKNNNDINEHINYRQPMYLARSSSILYEILNKTLNCSLKKKDRQLWQSYLDIGLQQHLWPDQFYTMAKTNDFDLCKQYVMNYIENNKKLLNHCQFELTKQEQQFQTCPMIELPFEQMEQRLQELVNRERKSTIDNDIRVSYYEQSTNRLISIREKQAEIWNEQLMLEIRIHCKFLPQNFNHLEDFISSIGYLPSNNNAKTIEIKNKRFKIIQEAKRLWLNYFLNIS
ncbi:unnamed protein product [Rotaria socialis]